MYRLLFLLLRSLSHWLILLSLTAAIGWLLWLSSGISQREQNVAEMLERSVQLKRELAAKSEELNSLALLDLRRRAKAYSKDLLVANDEIAETLKTAAEPAYASVRWNLDDIELVRIPDADGAPLDSVHVAHRASMPLEVGEINRLDYVYRLPAMAALRLSQLLWTAAPYKEFESLRILRAEDGFELELGIYMPTWSLEKQKQLMTGGTDG